LGFKIISNLEYYGEGLPIAEDVWNIPLTGEEIELLSRGFHPTYFWPILPLEETIKVEENGQLLLDF